MKDAKTKHPSAAVPCGREPRDPASSVPFDRANIEVKIRMTTDKHREVLVWWPGDYHQGYYSFRRDGLPHTVSLESDDEYGLVIETGFIRLREVVVWRYQQGQTLPPERMLQAVEEHIEQSLITGEVLDVELKTPGEGGVHKFSWSTEDHPYLGQPRVIEPADDYDGGTDAPFPHEREPGQ